MSTRLYYGDILDLDVDVVVNAANTQLQHGGSLAAAIVKRGGAEIQEESDCIGWCELGSAVATGAGSLSARHVIHVPTIDYPSRRRATLEDIEHGTGAALDLTRNLGVRSIAFPLLGTGFVGLKSGEVARAMMRAMADFGDLDITLCVHYQADWGAMSLVWEQEVDRIGQSHRGGNWERRQGSPRPAS